MCPTSLHKLLKVEKRTPNIAVKFGQAGDLGGVTTRKKMVSRVAGKQAGGKIIIGISERYRSG